MISEISGRPARGMRHLPECDHRRCFLARRAEMSGKRERRKDGSKRSVGAILDGLFEE